MPALSLSEEMKQRLCIARLLTVEPEIILLDTCSALDPIATMRVEELMIGASELHDSHRYPWDATGGTETDYTGFMLLGDAVIWGNPQIFTSPKDERTEGYITGRFG